VDRRSPEHDAWIATAKAAPLEDTARRLGAQLKRLGGELVGPCPKCGGKDRFSISSKKGVWNCGHAGGAGGDVISLVRHVNQADFLEAVEFLAGPCPDKPRNGHDPEALREFRQEQRGRAKDNARDRDALDASARGRRRDAAAGLWADGLPIIGTKADAYLRARGIVLQPSQAFDLRFVADLAYHGYRGPEDEEGAVLGAFPAMIAAIRNGAGDLIGVHRTYLDPERPRKLEAPGDAARNRAKKVLGNAKGGMIRLSAPSRRLAAGEGIETTLSWFALGLGPDDVSIAAAVSLGNMSGSSLKSLPHPKIAERSIPSGEPDPERPGMELGPGVEELILLGDGDSDPYRTRAHLLCASRRFGAQGLMVTVSMAPDDSDFGDVLMAAHKDEAA
jgi:CHC2 zinc finger